MVQLNRCKSVSWNAGGSKVALQRSLSTLSAHQSVEKYVRGYFLDAKANVAQFLIDYEQDRLPPGLTLNIDVQAAIDQCPNLATLSEDTDPNIDKLKLILSCLQNMMKSLPYTTTSDTTSMVKLLLRAAQDIQRVVVMLQDQALARTADGNVSFSSKSPDGPLMAGKEILAASYLIDLFLASQIEL